MKEPKYKRTRSHGLNWLANQLPASLGGGVVKEKRKRKKKLEAIYKKGKKY